jgi:hypothetical protein
MMNSMNKNDRREFGIRYRTPQGVEGIWWIPASDVRDGSVESPRAFLRYWHPDYEFLRIAVEADVMPSRSTTSS